MGSFESSTLLRYVRRLDDQYFGKVLELRESVRGWLEYIPETFPHYTRHTIGHSEQIILQLSKLLYIDDDTDKPSLRLTPTEAYILAAAAFLHDAGMVCSDAEKIAILEDDTWKSWITNGGGRERWLAIDQLRKGRHPSDDSTRHFLADIQTRFLIAEFVRRVHHERAGTLVKQHEEHFGRFAFADPDLQQAIAEVCIAHGISRDHLDDRIRFPVLRQIRGDDVNLRLLAILFRLGDLLDLHNSRACPLLLNAACPLPPDSFAHWTQYKRIEHRAVSPDIIEIRAQCQTPEEHRVLRDWCQWIADEVAAAPRLLASSSSRTRWRPPQATMTGENATILIEPAIGAKYRDRDWRFEIDSSEIFQRLISDVYDDPWQFLRELIQNALDAMRCQIYLDNETTGEPRPEHPTLFRSEIRQHYVLRIGIADQSTVNEHTGKAEAEQIVTVDDCGIGMDEEIVRRFLLQVGKSYYRTEDFRRQFRFVPDSQFGIGFLSVFAASDHVEIETCKPTSSRNDGPLKIILTGPRSYLVIEDGRRRTAGTHIQVRLNPKIQSPPGALAERIKALCKRVEFPIEVSDFGAVSMINHEEPEKFCFEAPDLDNPGADFVVRSVELSGPDIRGEAYILVHRGPDGAENWTMRNLYEREYFERHPEAHGNSIPGNLICHHGLSVEEHGSRYVAGYRNNCTLRLDYRTRDVAPVLSRHSLRRSSREKSSEASLSTLRDHLTSVLQEHISTTPFSKGPNSWIYLQRLADCFAFTFLTRFWDALPGTIRTMTKSGVEFLTFDQVRSAERIVEIFDSRLQRSLFGNSYYREAPPRAKPNYAEGAVAIEVRDLPWLSDDHARRLLFGREVSKVWWLDEIHLAVDWSLTGGAQLSVDPFYPTHLCTLPTAHTLAVDLSHPYPVKDQHLVNDAHPLAQWMLRLEKDPEAAKTALPERLKTLNGLVQTAIKSPWEPNLEKFKQNLVGWNELGKQNPSVRPPDTRVDVELFRMPPPRRTRSESSERQSP